MKRTDACSTSHPAKAIRTNFESWNPPQKRVKQDGEDALPGGGAYLISSCASEECSHHYALITEASSTRTPTSFLDLPDDVLLPIFEEFYEQRYESITPTTPLRIAEILITKRIFLLARPLWHKRLSITEAQLDARLSGLLEDRTRQASLSNLKFPLSNTFANLTKTVISLLPRLTELSLAFDESVQESTSSLVADRIARSNSLRQLSLSTSHSLALLAGFNSRYRAQNPFCEVNVLLTHGDNFVQAIGRRKGLSLCSYKYRRGYSLNWPSARWNTTHSLNLLGPGGLVIPAQTLIETVQHAMGGATVSLVPHRQHSLIQKN